MEVLPVRQIEGICRSEDTDLSIELPDLVDRIEETKEGYVGNWISLIQLLMTSLTF